MCTIDGRARSRLVGHVDESDRCVRQLCQMVVSHRGARWVCENRGVDGEIRKKVCWLVCLISVCQMGVCGMGVSDGGVSDIGVSDRGVRYMCVRYVCVRYRRVRWGGSDRCVR